ncbi:transposase [Methylomicrobium sp. Wu6]|uniref:transposase n=1 Tax=Methylomicrobium sp. Wu6 TaxID=3107928 RepID=UPI002DD68DB6|nr:transposase [Methylomicrobium sp. Wu6]MEC4748327.1 transposase [Methylomicrobium sp. Wu6]
MGLCGDNGADDRATFVEVPRQRNSRDENAKVKAGEIPAGWDEPEQALRRRQKDTDARWTQKNEEKHYGYKNPINADESTKLIQHYRVIPANVHDSQVFEALLDTETTDAQGRKSAVYADSAYRSQEHEAHLEEQRIDSQFHEKGTRSARDRSVRASLKEAISFVKGGCQTTSRRIRHHRQAKSEDFRCFRPGC